MMGPLLLSTESKGGKRVHGDEAVFFVALHFFLSPRYRSREIPHGARREYEWQDVATNMRDYCKFIAKYRDVPIVGQGLAMLNSRNSQVRPCTSLVVVHRRRVDGTPPLSLMQPRAWPSLVFRLRHKQRIYAVSLTSLLLRVEERHNKIHRKTVGTSLLLRLPR